MHPAFNSRAASRILDQGGRIGQMKNVGGGAK